MSKIVRKEEVVPNIHMLEIEAPRIAEKVKPGQFVIAMADEFGERIPFTISDWDVEKGTITLYIIETGISTMKFAKMSEGDELYGLVGPLGKKVEIKKYGKVLLGGGCYGIGGIYPIARALKEAGNGGPPFTLNNCRLSAEIKPKHLKRAMERCVFQKQGGEKWNRSD